MTEVYAVTPRANSGGLQLHIFIPGYRPGTKARSLADRSALCNAPVWTTLRRGQVETVVRQHVPLAQALEWTATPPTDPFDPRPAWRWCATCVGRYIEAYGDLTAAIRAVPLPTTPEES